MFNDSVLTNVSLGDTIPEATIKDSLRQAGALEFCERLPEGIRTVVGERGGRLSGGQRQRIAPARALAVRPRVLILDEPTSGLDPATSDAILNTLRELKQHMTILIVTHQAGPLAVADTVLSMAGGRLAVETAGALTK